MTKFQPFLGVFRVLSAAAGLFFLTEVAPAQDMKVEARLIWGTDTETNADHKIEDPRLNEDLSRIFKWKTYYQITNCTVVVPLNATQSMEMSSKCVLKVKNLGDSRAEVSCFGNGKWVCKGAYSLSSGKWLTLGGADKNESAWFIVMRSRAPKDPAKVAVKIAPAVPKVAEKSNSAAGNIPK